MLRINLLPRTINENARKTSFLAVWVLGNAAVIALFLIMFAGAQSRYTAAKAANDVAHDKKTQYDGVASQIDTVNTQIADTQKKEDFVANSQKYNDGWPSVFSLMRDVTSDHVVLHSLNIDPAAHQTLSVAGFAPDEATIIGWWMYLRNNRDKFNSVTFSLPSHAYVPGETGDNGGFGNPMGQRSGMPGMGGIPGGMMPGMAGMGGPGMGGPGKGANLQTLMRGGTPTMGGSPGMGGMGRGGGGGGIASVGYLEGRKGLEFTATAVLKEPMAGGIPAPSWPGAEAAGAGGMGGMMGPMGGGPGMPGGMMPGMPGMPGGMGRGPMGGAPVGPPAGASGKKDNGD